MRSRLKEKLRAYLNVKWFIFFFVAAFLLIESMLGVFQPASLHYAIFAILAIVLSGLLMSYLLRVDRLPPYFPEINLVIDSIILALALYMTGGTENNWWFLLIFPVFIAGYVFSQKVALVFAALASALITGIFCLEFIGLLPHMPIHNLPQTVYESPNFLVDYVFGMIILYFSGAWVSGLFNKLLSRSNDHLDKSLELSRASQKEAEDSRLAMQNIMEDLARAKVGLEAGIRERTAELEEAKHELENKVRARTLDLENSRKAILHMMKDLKEDVNKLQEIDRMKTEFLSMVSHELRTPLTPLKGYLGLLLAGRMGKLTPKQKKIVAVLQRQSDHLDDLINSLLDISRLELGKPIPTEMQPLSINKVINNLLEALLLTVKARGLKVKTSLAKNPPTIIGDEIKLKRVLTNLLGNALKFTPKGGEISIKTIHDKDNIRVEIVDNGIGLAREYTEKIFEKFFQIDSSYTRSSGGIGLGLAIARELIELHGGKLWAESDGLGRGSKFIATLPLSKKGESSNG